MKKTKNAIIISAGAVVLIALACGIVFFAMNRIPSKYHGTYTRYTYLDGEERKETYKISALSIEKITERTEEEKEEMSFGSDPGKIKKIKYQKNGADIIIQIGKMKSYLIVDGDCLYIETNRDISLSKKYGNFFWNEKSEKADIYEIENRVEGIENLIRETMKTWGQEMVYKMYNRNNSATAEDIDTDYLRFYMTRTEEEPDETDLNTYEIEFNVPSGSLSLSYDRETRKLSSIFCSGDIAEYGADGPEFVLENLLDTRALLVSCMYVLGRQGNTELNQDTKNETEDLYRDTIMTEYNELFSKKEVESENDTTYNLNNDKYDIIYRSNTLIFVDMFHIFLN